MDSTYYLSLFLDEGRERLQQLAELFVELESRPADRELLADMFRTVHTFKGMADTMDFADLVALTHAMEGVLDALRRGRLELDPALTRVMLACLDALEGRIEAIEGGPDTKGGDFPALEAELAQALARVHPANEAPAEIRAVVPAAPQPGPEGSRTFRIDVTLDPSCFMKSARALVITSSLEMLGAVRDITPSLEELEWDEAGDAFSVVLVTDAGAEAIAAMIADLSEIAGTRIEELTEALAAAVPLAAAERQMLATAHAAGLNPLWIEVAFVAGTPQKAARASLALEALAEFGQLIRVEPELSALERDGHDAFRLLFATHEDPATLRESLLPVREILTVNITAMGEPETPSAEHAEVSTRPARRMRSVRVEAERLDGLMDLLGALAIGQTRLARVLERQGAAERADVRDALDDLTGMTQRLREAMLGLRLVPLDMVFNRYPRVVRDLSRELGKQVSFSTVGGELPLDRLLVDELGELLVHLIRNALDHGLETPGERQAAGKPDTCHLTLEARLEGVQVLIRVADDGRGIDAARVAEQAVARGILDAEVVRRLPPERQVELIFLPGLSTSAEATRLSGRGVGLDAVKNKVDALGGFIHLDTAVGRGTTFELRFPLPRDFVARAGEPAREPV